MPPLADFVARGATYLLTACATILIAAFFAFAILVGFGGTGGFTSTPPPDRPAWLGIMLCVGIWAVLQWGVLRLHRILLSALDRVSIRK